MLKRKITSLGLHNPSDNHQVQGVFTYSRFEETIRAAPVRTTLHRHEFDELFIFEKGAGQYHGDFCLHDVSSPIAVIVAAGTVHEWPLADQLVGHALAFDLDFLEAHGRTTGPASIFRPPVPVIIPLGSSELSALKPLLSRINDEWEQEYPHRRSAIQAALSLILIDLRRIHDDQSADHLSPASQLYSAFLDCLEIHWKNSPKPKDLAAELRVSPDHLSATLRGITGMNTSGLIAERIMLEAKRLLAHSRMGVAEIGYEVGFEDPSYFARFFKRKTGFSPKEFRESLEK